MDIKSSRTVEGTIRYVDKYEGFWGIEIQKSFLGIPITTKQMSFAGPPIHKELPREFQIDGLKVKCTYKITDVIGMYEWDTVIRIISIEKLEQ